MNLNSGVALGKGEVGDCPGLTLQLGLILKYFKALYNFKRPKKK